MAETNEVLALQKVSTEVDKSQIKIILSSQCIKAQAFLYDKLTKQSDRLKEECTFMSSTNLKLKTEIQLAEQEIKSLNLALETIGTGNIQLQKVYLLSKERKVDIYERTKNGIKKYEAMWLTSKNRYENIPCVKKLIDTKNKYQIIQSNVNSLINESRELAEKMEKKSHDLFNTDKARIMELANYFVYEKPKLLESINEKNIKIKVISKEIQTYSKQQKNINISNLVNELSLSPCHKKQIVEIIKDKSVDDNWSNLSKTDKDTLVLPRLHLQNTDLDILSVRLNQIKKVDLQNLSIQRSKSSKCLDLEYDTHKKYKTEENINKSNISSHPDNVINTDDENNDEKVESVKYSNKKLIHILENIKLDKNDTYNIINKLEPKQFQETKYITSKSINHTERETACQEKIIKSFEIEEIDLTSKEYDYEAVAPPTQFIDNTQEKKTVTFNIPHEDRVQTLCEDVKKPEESKVKSQEKILNVSATSEESYNTIKDMILKKHNLDLSPQFVYAKNTLQQMNEDKIVTSKFFENMNEMDLKQDQTLHKNSRDDVNNDNLNSKTTQDINAAEKPITGLLFNHGPEGILESFNVSISTTGFDDSEDFAHCIDSSILSSPKADLPTTAASTGDEVLSQEVPNFLTGFRKKGLSFFGSTSTSDQKPDSSAQNQNSGFNFTFGSDEKKGRGGLFSMFR